MIRLIFLTLFLAGLASAAVAAETRDPYTYFFNPSTGDLKAELSDAKTAGKKAVFVMFEQEGCPGCLFMKENILNQPAVQKFYRDRFVNLSVDIFGSVPLNDFAGRNVAEKTFAQLSRIRGTPTLVFYDLAGNEVTRLLHGVEGAAA